MQANFVLWNCTDSLQTMVKAIEESTVGFKTARESVNASIEGWKLYKIHIQVEEVTNPMEGDS